MTLSAGTKLGRYEIRSKIGGMDEGYRAYDSTMHREVAIKVLPASLSADKERLARFEQEAQAAGALHHPNILTIHHIDTPTARLTSFPNCSKARRRAIGWPAPRRRNAKPSTNALQIIDRTYYGLTTTLSLHGLTHIPNSPIVCFESSPANPIISFSGILPDFS